MLSYAARRLPLAILVVWMASVLVFFGSRLVPGDPASVLAGADATPAVISAIDAELGLNEPLPLQYLKWLGGLLTGHLGHSYILGTEIGPLIARGASNTLELAVAALLLGVVLGFAVGIYGALRDSTIAQVVVTGYAMLGFGIPNYVMGVLMLLVFAVLLRVLPVGGNPVPFLQNPEIGIQYLIMPAFVLSLPLSAVLSRFLMTSLRQVMQEDYIRMAIAKGLPRTRIVLRHGLPNALPPVLTILGLQIAGLLGGAVIIEQLFDWPGVGRLMLEAVQRHDYLIAQDLALFAVILFVLVQLLTDLAYAALDPRVNLQR